MSSPPAATTDQVLRREAREPSRAGEGTPRFEACNRFRARHARHGESQLARWWRRRRDEREGGEKKATALAPTPEADRRARYKEGGEKKQRRPDREGWDGGDRGRSEVVMDARRRPGRGQRKNQEGRRVTDSHTGQEANRLIWGSLADAELLRGFVIQIGGVSFSSSCDVFHHP